ncbi:MULTISPECIES: bifunctional 3-(3-hydroxy-phenyl)propionate/3-hydroxycinnamic acid hydroxylase MhpA [Paraburkholderia]|uniref:Bifunctional 3-(3-hydroxy-phenyl)propionate/3-hydroxycinnamic acid hydroxylase n=1 Tax=Paraburkholderia podalyriae TaxID=1938811 RepID=A0ABR7Q150_9BURK|nr:bifunctional 3-(3-hydroxy-phenyl)propionate/3-hydroxycinnamic acid hydroxylase [Paraburkholderia podalyriae]MBC8752276.1 bifunctional 3-(3-hydroxy-phenyl)propionate/3-hydroxycinnamic acid hydroxylase [Paraburkholderia podalyriae]
METYDAIIAGFGPTGATLANLLGTMGMRVAVVEREKGIYDQPRAITADHEAMRAFQAVGLAERIEAGTCPHPGTDFVGVNGEVIKRFYPMPAPGPLGWEPTFMFYQPRLEAVLRDGVKRFADIDLMLEHSLISVRQDAEGIEVMVAGPDGAQKTLRAATLLGCDGARSVVRAQIGASVHDLAFDEWWVVVDVNLHGDIELPERCVQYCRPSRPGTYIVGPDRLRRWEIKVMPGEAPESFNDPGHLDRVLSTFVDTRGVDVKRVAIYRFHAVVAEQWREGRVFLLGDAAHQMPPFLGQGLCAGVRDAYNLAWKLDAVRKGKAADSLLDTYGAERRPHVQTVVEHAKSFGLIIGELDEVAALERDRMLGAELAAGTATTVRQAFIPGLAAGLLYGAERGELGVGAGELFPQPWVSGPALERTRLDDLVRGDFYIVTNEAQTAQTALESLRAVPQLAQAKVVCIGEAPDVSDAVAGVIRCTEEGDFVSRFLADHGAVAAMVRPDGFAYGSATSTEAMADVIATLGRALAGEPATPPTRTGAAGRTVTVEYRAPSSLTI